MRVAVSYRVFVLSVGLGLFAGDAVRRYSGQAKGRNRTEKNEIVTKKVLHVTDLKNKLLHTELLML